MHNIVFFVNSLDYLHSHRGQIVEELVERGCKVSVLFGEASSSLVSHYLQLGIDVRRVNLSRGSMSILRHLSCLIQITSFLLQRKVDILHLISLQAIFVGGAAAKFCNVKAVVFSVSGMGSLYYKMRKPREKVKYFVLNLLFKFCFSVKNKKVICQNEYDSIFLQKNFSVDKSDILVFQGAGVDLFKFKGRSNDNEVIKIAFVGRLLKDKGILDFLEAARSLDRFALDHNVRFVIAGQRDAGSQTSITSGDIEKYAKFNFIEFVGFQADIPNFLLSCDVVCLPSYHEGFPKALMEAAAAGCAVITSDVPGCRDAVLPGVTAFLVPVSSPDKIAHFIKKLVTDAELRKSMGERGRLMAHEKFGVTKIVAAHIDVYSKLTRVSL